MQQGQRAFGFPAPGANMFQNFESYGQGRGGSHSGARGGAKGGGNRGRGNRGRGGRGGRGTRFGGSGMCWPLPELPGPAASGQSRPPPRAASQSKHNTPVAASAAAAAADPSSDNKAAAAALRANIVQKPKVPTTVPSEHSRAEAVPAAASGNATAAAAVSQAANPAVVNLVANNPNLRRNPGRQSLPHGGKLTYQPTSRTLNPSAPNAVSHTPQTLNPNAPNTRNPNTPTPNIRKQPPFQSPSALQAKRQPFQRPQPHFTTPPKRPVQPRQPPGRPHQPPMLNLATDEEANPNQSQPGQQADFEYDAGYHPGSNNNFTGNFSHPQGGYGHDYMPYSDFDPPGLYDEPQRSQYNNVFSEDAPNYSCGIPAPVVGNAAMASYGANPEAVLGQKRKFCGPPQAGPHPPQRPFTRRPDPPVGPAKAPEYPSNGHTGKLGVQGDYDAHNPQGETFMERRMQWALHRLHTLEERMVQIETAGGAYDGV